MKFTAFSGGVGVKHSKIAFAFADRLPQFTRSVDMRLL